MRAILLSLTGLVALLSLAWGEDVDPLNLYNEAEALGTRNALVMFGKTNLVIRGTSLEGDGIKRPASLLGRAAELWAERAVASGKFDPNTKFEIHGKYDDMTHALLIWRELRDWSTPVGYLRLLRKQAGTSNVSLAAACDYEIAQCYEQQGDLATAVELYSAYSNTPCTDDNIGRCKAAYALSLLKEDRYADALAIAKEVKDKCRPQDVSISADKDAYGLAIQVLSLIPAEYQGEQVAIMNTEESNLLTQAKENPRRYFRLGQIAEQRHQLTKAIEYYNQYRRSFPTDETSLNLGVRIGAIYAQQKNYPKAVETYEMVWKYGLNSSQAVAARVAAAKIHIQDNRMLDAVKLMKEGIEKTTQAAFKAELISNLAEMYLSAKKVDEATDLYIDLLNKYGEQNAAQGVLVKLKLLAPQVKNWRPLTQDVFTWLTGGPNGRPVFGNAELRPQAASDLRRFALTFYIQNNELREGVAWLERCGTKARDEDTSYLILDEAWLYGEGLRAIGARFRQKVKATEAPVYIDMGLRGWKIARDKNEGWDSLRETANFVIWNKPKSDRVKKLRDELLSLQGTPYEDQAMDLLVNVLDAIGEKKEAEKIRQSR